MITSEAVTATIKLYSSHGWILRSLRVPVDVLEGMGEMQPGVTASPGDFGFAWFSRPPGAGPIAWEIRYLGEPPYALVEHLDESSPDFKVEISAVEDRLRAIIASRIRGH